MARKVAAGVALASIIVVVVCVLTRKPASILSNDITPEGRDISPRQGHVPEFSLDRVLPKRPAIDGVVLDYQGGPVSGARVVWLVLQHEDIEMTPAWPDPDWGVPERVKLETVSGENGAFEFDQTPIPGTPYGSTLIAYSPAHFPGGVDLRPEPQDWPSPVQIRVEAVTAVDVYVESADGLPVPGSLVHHVGAGSGAARDEERIQHDRFFSEVGVT